MAKKKGNILITVVFILFIISLMGIIVTKYLENMMSYSSELYKYFNAYYRGYAGIELELTKIKHHDFGFEDKIEKDSGTNEWNFKYCNSFNCYFESEVKSKATLLTDNINSWNETSCTNSNAYAENNGGGFLIPLYRDSSEGEGVLSGNGVTYMSQSQFGGMNLIALNSHNKNFAVGVAITDDLSRNIVSKVGNLSPQTIQLGTLLIPNFNSSKKSFLVVSNTESSAQSQSFCINSPIKLPTKYLTITSVGRFGDRFVSLQAIKANSLPDYLIYNIIN